MTKSDVLILTPEVINRIRRQTVALVTAPLVRPIYICDSCGVQFGDIEVDAEPTPFGTSYTTTKSHCANPLLWAEERSGTKLRRLIGRKAHLRASALSAVV